VFVGYRWFDHSKIEPLFPFGFGLSYTSFDYSGMRCTPASDGGIDVFATIRNVGTVPGDEVAQVYLEKPQEAPAGVQFPDRVLAGFERVHLAQGESREIEIHVPLRSMQYWSTVKHSWMTPAGSRTLWIGASSRDKKLLATVDSLPPGT
jgi:beta-glucosidase